MRQSAGLYLSVPFCKAKCTYCNFASGVFGADRMDRYVERVCREIAGVRVRATAMSAVLPGSVDSIFLGGGTPSLLSAEQMQRLFAAMRGEFDVADDAEITLECAPGQLAEETLDAMLRLGMNRISFGVQSFVDAEAKAVGRLHTRDLCLAEIERMRTAGVRNINVDLIAGLPGQTAASWRESVEIAIASKVPHVSVYMLEVDEESRLGREMLAEGTRYGAANVPSEDDTADWYGLACEWLAAAEIHQYEISNFACEGHASRHNLKYWKREPYVGFGLDAHSMLPTSDSAVRWANSSDLESYLGPGREPLQMLATALQPPTPEWVTCEQAFEESLFLGLRLNEGISLAKLFAEFGPALADPAIESMQEMQQAGMLRIHGDRIALTARGRMASNEVFSRLLVGRSEESHLTSAI